KLGVDVNNREAQVGINAVANLALATRDFAAPVGAQRTNWSSEASPRTKLRILSQRQQPAQGHIISCGHRQRDSILRRRLQAPKLVVDIPSQALPANPQRGAGTQQVLNIDIGERHDCVILERERALNLLSLRVIVDVHLTSTSQPGGRAAPATLDPHVIAHVLRHAAGNVDATKTAKASLGLITERDLAGHIEQTTDVRLSEGRRGHDRHQRNSGQDDRELPHHSCTPQFVLWILVCLWFHTPSPGVPAESFPVSFPRTVPGLRVGRFPAPVASVKLSPSHLLSHCATARKRDWKHFTLPVGGLYSPTWSGFLL